MLAAAVAILVAAAVPFLETLTSREFKVKTKSNNITGLQVAGLVAHPSFKAPLARQCQEVIPNNFGGRTAQILSDSK